MALEEECGWQLSEEQSNRDSCQCLFSQKLWTLCSNVPFFSRALALACYQTYQAARACPCYSKLSCVCWALQGMRDTLPGVGCSRSDNLARSLGSMAHFGDSRTQGRTVALSSTTAAACHSEPRFPQELVSEDNNLRVLWTQEGAGGSRL
jgi:hypothetical protein